MAAQRPTIRLALTYDDVLLVPVYSEVLPHEASLHTQLGPRLVLKAPILSAAMDSVTEAPMAIAMALQGGLGVIHKNISAAQQADEVARVKGRALSEPERQRASLDEGGALRVAAALGVSSSEERRAEALIGAGVDALVVDTAHGHSRGVLEAIKRLRARYPEVTLIGGNIATASACEALIDAGADVVKVGIGPGSICTTRVVAGVGVPQLTALFDCVQVARARHIGVIADGGIKTSGDVVKALAAGADAVMLGGMLAGCEEAPGELVERDGLLYKGYRGMGSVAAMKLGSSERYSQQQLEPEKLVPEGVEGEVPSRGPLEETLDQIKGGVRAGMGYLGAADLGALRARAEFVRLTSAGLRESHVHDLSAVKSAPNYSPS